ncbi:Similar to TMEM53: Transmembrane protein 53 (Bos taurus) [Cotesia congregata]|uniref:Similar to TMEM53: Transmembrane protein 53 (Bos taurus) n=1 Tax=Cotesia congregata TaxID=51543 RepID=A0A8J2H8N1_COTCN|nr:Similar to TMEM53: Transmembrane protein 53 (Bos taurus) [Cotesia congregata]
MSDLNYHIVYRPNPNAANSDKNVSIKGDIYDTDKKNVAELSRDDFVFIYEDNKKPVIVLLGWAGCQDKYLAKYSAIYEERSFITLRCTAPVEYLFLRHDKLPSIGRKLLNIIKERNLDEHPIIFHIFSNGGAYLYQHVSLAMDQINNNIKVKGVIFDSAPGERRITSLFKAISAIMGGNPVVNIPFSFVITVFLSLLWICETISNSLGITNLPSASNPYTLINEPNNWPQLFLYSNADTLIPAADVEKFANHRAKRGVEVKLVLFTDSPHVKHYAIYRDVYINTVCNFINDCSSEKLNPAKNNTEDNPTGNDSLLGYENSFLKITKQVILPIEATANKQIN